MQSSSRQPRKWTLEEDQKLREEVEIQLAESGDVKDWCRVAAELPGRTNKDCRKRWHNSVAGGLKKGQWSKSEDMLLSRAVQQYGQRWTLVANCVESRSADQCAKRWQQSLDPDLDRSEWREDEDQILIEATQQLGRHWKDIQREHFPGRSKNCIKNRYTVLVRRYQNQGITLPSRGSSPSEANTPGGASPFSHDEDDYLPYDTDMYGNLMPPKSSGRASSHRSWPSFDADDASWPNPEDYNSSMEGQTRHYSHTATPMPTFTYPQPQAFSPHMAAAPAASWNWTTSPRMEASPTTYNRSPTSYTHETNLAPHHYDDYSMTRPLISSSRSYSSPSGRAAFHSIPTTTSTHVSRSSSWSEPQHYDSPDMYGDPRLQQLPSYRF